LASASALPRFFPKWLLGHGIFTRDSGEGRRDPHLVKNWEPDYLRAHGSGPKTCGNPPSWPWSKLENAANDAAFRAHRSPIDRHSLRAGRHGNDRDGDRLRKT
jgi:hypothetical protein